MIHGTRKTSVVHLLKSIAPYAIASFVVSLSAVSVSAFAQSAAGNNTPASVTVQSGDLLTTPPNVATSTKATELFTPVTQVNTPKIYSKPVASGPAEMDLRQLWNELKTNNPQLSSLRESYLSAKATVPQIAAPANPQVGLVWSGMPANSPFALGAANTQIGRASCRERVSSPV